jgi:cobalamin biosynthesis protein CobD/CbiB
MSSRRINAALRSRTSAFIAGSIALIVVPLLTIGVMLLLDSQPIETYSWMAIILGNLTISAAAIGLMAALVASDRSSGDSRGGSRPGDEP